MTLALGILIGIALTLAFVGYTFGRAMGGVLTAMLDGVFL